MKKLLKRIGITIGVLLLLALIALGVLVGINAMDEDLSADTKQLMAATALPAPSEKNAYVHFLGERAPEGTAPYAHGLKVLEALKVHDKPGFARTAEWEALMKSPQFDKDARICLPEVAPCVGAPAEATDAAIEKYRARLEQHRRLRAVAEFDELYIPTRAASLLPNYQGLFYAQYLSLAAAARKADKGELAGALDELEADLESHRRMLAGSRILITKMISVALVARDTLLASELIRAKGGDELRDRATKLLRPLSPAEASMQAVFDGESRFIVGGFLDATAGEMAFAFGIDPMLARLELLFLRRHETTNELVRRMRAYDGVLKSTPATYDAAKKALAASRPAPQEGFPGFVNPFGKMLLDAGTPNYEDYVARIHDLQALIAAVAAQNALRKAGAATPDEVKAQLAGEAGRANPNPYTAQPFEYDATTNTLLFTPKAKAGWSQQLVKRYKGKIGIVF